MVLPVLCGGSASKTTGERGSILVHEACIWCCGSVVASRLQTQNRTTNISSQLHLLACSNGPIGLIIKSKVNQPLTSCLDRRRARFTIFIVVAEVCCARSVPLAAGARAKQERWWTEEKNEVVGGRNRNRKSSKVDQKLRDKHGRRRNVMHRQGHFFRLRRSSPHSQSKPNSTEHVFQFIGAEYV